MSKVQLYKANTGKPESFEFPKEHLVEPNMNLLSQALFVLKDRSHKGSSKVKTRSEVNATGAKMYKQKGTGNARHGDRKAPIFKGGGIAHGPKGVKRSLKLSSTLKKRALRMALSIKVKAGKLAIVDKLESLTKTKDAKKLINSIKTDFKLNKNSKLVLALTEGKKEASRVFRNIENISLNLWRNLDARNVSSTPFLIIEKEAIEGKVIQNKEKTKPAINKKTVVEKTVKKTNKK